MAAKKTALAFLLILTGCGTPPAVSNEQANVAGPATNRAVKAQPSPPTANEATPGNDAVPDPSASRIDFAALAGQWQVVHVAIGGGVGALAKDDPAYMGRKLEIGPDRLVWATDAKPAPGASLTDRCDGPVTARQTGAAAREYDEQFATQLTALDVKQPDPHAVECDAGQWGPEAAGGAILFPVSDRRLAMSWYDGGVLLLERQDRP